MPKTEGRRRSRLTTRKKLLFALVPLLGLLGVLEGVQRFLDWKACRKRLERGSGWELQTNRGEIATDKEGGLVLQHRPYVLYRMKPDTTRTKVTVNHVGYRVPEWPTADEPKSGRRVFVLGGSTAFGLGCDDRESFAFLLDERLRDEGTRVFNAGMIGYHSSQEVVLLAQQICQLSPDLVVVVDGYNDFTYSAMMPAGAHELTPPMFEQFDVLLGRNTERLANVMRVSALWRSLERSLFPGPSSMKGVVYHDNGALGVPLYRHNLTTMARLAKAFGAKVLLAPQPELFARKAPIPDAEQAERDRSKDSHPSYAEVAPTYARYVAAAKATAAEEGAAFVDVAAAIDAADGVLFSDQCHLTADGNRVVCEALLPVVRRMLD